MYRIIEWILVGDKVWTLQSGRKDPSKKECKSLAS